MKIIFRNILDTFDSFTKSIADIEQPTLISFAFQLNDDNKFAVITQLSELYEDIFYFQTSGSKQTFIGINSSINLQSTSADKFSAVFDNYNYWKKNFITNWNEVRNSACSIIFCTAKFDPANSSSDWDEFDSLRVYVPEFILAFQGDKLFGYYNFIIDKNVKIDSYLNVLSGYINKLSELNTEQAKSFYLKTSINSKANLNDLTIWKNVSLDALKILESDEISKLVLSRTNKFDLNSKINWNSLLQELSDRFPDCYLFFIKKYSSIFFGSTPEMFLKVSNNIVEVESVAGSAARDKKTELDNELEMFLKTSEKNQREHFFVSDFITGILIKYSNNVRVIEEKQIRKLDNIQHLITRISAELNSKEILFELIDSLFPTPAVCGVPKEKAMDLIRKLETHDRGLYSGLVGIIDFENNCELAVSIRSALVKENQVTAFAGAGFVMGSDPKEELDETNLKLKTILSLFTDEN